MAVRRFRSGTGEIQPSDNTRFRRGQQPIRVQQQTYTSNKSEQQKENLNLQIEAAREQLRVLEQQQVDESLTRTQRRNVQVGLYGIKARLTYLESAQQGLEGGNYYENFTEINQGAQQAEDNAKQAARDRIKEGIQNRQERIQRQTLEKETKPGTDYQELEGGLFSIGGRVFTKEGQEVLLQSTSEGIRGYIPEKEEKSVFPKPSSFAGVQGQVYRGTGVNLLEYEDKPLIQRVGIGVGKAVVGVGDFLGRVVQSQGVVLLKKEDLSSQTGTTALKEIFFGKYKKFEVPGVSYIREAPANVRGIKEGFYITNLALITAGSYQVGKEGIVSSIKSIAPFKIKPGFYGALETGKELKFDVVSISKQKGDTTFKVIKGYDGSKTSRVFSEQKFKNIDGKIFGSARTTVSAKVTYISPSGDIQQGIRVLNFKSFIKSTGEGKVTSFGKNIIRDIGDVGFTSKVLTSKKAEFLAFDEQGVGQIDLSFKGKNQLVGGVNFGEEGKVVFLSGKALKGINLKKGSFVSRLKSFNLRGIELKLPETDSYSVGSNFIRTTQERVNPTSQLSFQQVSATISSIKPSSIKIPSVNLKIIPSIDLKQETKQIAVSQIKQENTSNLSVKLIPKSLIKTESQTKQQPRTLNLQKSSTLNIQLNKFKTLTLTSQRSTNINQTIQKQRVYSGRGTYPGIETLQLTKKPLFPFLFPPIKQKKLKQPKNIFTVLVRRRGKFRPVGQATNIAGAFNIGRFVTSNTLAATFKVTGVTKDIGVPTGFKKKRNKKEGVLYIELPKFRLNTRTEVAQIQRARKR